MEASPRDDLCTHCSTQVVEAIAAYGYWLSIFPQEGLLGHSPDYAERRDNYYAALERVPPGPLREAVQKAVKEMGHAFELAEREKAARFALFEEAFRLEKEHPMKYVGEDYGEDLYRAEFGDARVSVRHQSDGGWQPSASWKGDDVTIHAGLGHGEPLTREQARTKAYSMLVELQRRQR